MEVTFIFTLLFISFYTLNSRKGNQNVQASPVGERLVNYKLDSKRLISMGKTLDKPILTLLGLTFEEQEEKINRTIKNEIESVLENANHEKDSVEDITRFGDELLKNTTAELSDFKRDTTAEIESIKVTFQEENEVLKSELCKLESCSEWSEWSFCSAKTVRTFGGSFRTRTCGLNSQFCISESANKTETETTICQGKQDSFACPVTYTLTANKSCIRVRNDVKMTWKDARSACTQDGGHLINIDSDLKAADIKSTLESMSLVNWTTFWIDGQKTSLSTTWKYEYGSENIGLSSWFMQEPDKSDERIIFYKVRGIWYLYGVVASGERPYICEII